MAEHTLRFAFGCREKDHWHAMVRTAVLRVEAEPACRPTVVSTTVPSRRDGERGCRAVTPAAGAARSTPRKSSEEGLEQEFNSLAAQREACDAYIRSQQHEGWVLARPRYDDGGFYRRQSGATSAAASACRYPGRPDRHCHRLQGRPAHAVARRFCPAGRTLRRRSCVIRLGDAAIQHDELDGATDAQCAVVVCSVRAGGHWRTHPRQDRRLKETGHVDGRKCSAGL